MNKKRKQSKTVKIKLNDKIVKICLKDILPGQIMYTQPESMIITKSGECWLLPDERACFYPNTIEDYILGVLKDFDDNYIVFARELGVCWEPIHKPHIPMLPIKELKTIASEVIESQKEYEETYYPNIDDEDDGNSAML
jgi:hypothetical protein